MKAKTISFVVALLVLFSVGNAFAQSPRLKSTLKATDLGTILQVDYDISGLGNVDHIVATLTYDANVSSLCYNPGKSTGPVPGQSKTYPATEEEIVIPVHNGRATGSFKTTTVFPAGACPNSQWRGEVSGVSFSNIILTVDGREFRVN